MAVNGSPQQSGRVRSHPLPPDDFDPRTASQAQLRRHGLPQRPDPAVRPELAERWDRVFSRKLTYITPELRPLHEVLPGFQAPERPRLPVHPEVRVTNGIWSGAVVHSANASQTFGWITGEWTVPDVAHAGSGSETDWSLVWIGIDGISDVTQIGTVQWVSSWGLKQCYAIQEWWPEGWQVITNFPVTFGDTVTGLICMTSVTEAWFNLINVTSGRAVVGVALDAPAGTSSQENQAEWVVERPGINGTAARLPRFGEVFFDEAYAGRGLEFLADAGSDTIIDMVEDGVTVATTTVETPRLIKVAYTGP
ncbi:G1 family glutamic endopeptidase [Xylanimonas sp. McL0601]|uniref:G1 family glutamic endopeptidase n=1 Tax=Xylanimonas sp. McL0601 TaxID=3414739 RepID=UPI003CF10458